MSSTYSTSLRIELIDTGTDNEAWGQPTDNNLGTIIEQAIVGSNTISLTNLTTYTLATANAAVDQARNAVLVFNGALTANCNVIAPSVKKVYVVSNKTTGGKFVNIKTSGGNAVQVINGTNQLVYCNGTDFISAVNVNTIIGNLSVSGNSTVGGNVTVSSNIAMGNVLTGTSGNLVLQSTTSNIINFQGTTGALIPPFGTTAQRPATPVVGMSRWNTDLGWYEIWNGNIWQQITGSYAINYLIVGGGGAGSGGGLNGGGGGGGSGQLIQSTFYANAGSSYSVTVGAGGPATYGGNASGTTSIISTIASCIGGSGGNSNDSGGAYPGGSGGTSGNGYAGGAGVGSDNLSIIAPVFGGGGGSSAVGGAAYTSGGVNAYGGAGGAGNASAITGSTVYYAGGGGGQGGTLGGFGGSGGGGTGATNTSGVTSGSANTGGGGGGGAYGSGAGGSGVVIFSYANLTQRATGGTVTSYTTGGIKYWVHTFTTSGTFAT